MVREVLSVVANRFKAYVELLRPFTLIAPFFVSFFIMLSSLIYNNKLYSLHNWWLTAVQASLVLALLNGASNTLNQATDVEADRISKPYRPIPRGVVSIKEAYILATVLYILVLIRAFTLNLNFGFFVALITFFTITYSLPPRMKKYLFLNQIWVSIPRGALGILASWSVFGDPLQKEPLIMGIIASLFLIGGVTTKDIGDSLADKKTGTYTLVNTYGTKKAAYISLPFLLAPFASIPFIVNDGILAPYLLPLSLLAIPSFLIFYLMIKESRSKKFENTRAWVLMYVEYLLLALGFAVLIMFGEMNKALYL
ncbi:MAG: 4-hydroxybenzoate polyprenyltransferase [Thermoplasmata archaeon]|nr:MAG: 4-hydroxybenzoate polyprenyltransferase [Thermoplasmata archaeon]